jgi:colanic acid/amylovoran biosynthesis glycosyltransferase
MAKESVIGVYRDRLLPSSETFVLAQSESLRHFIPYYLGSRYVPGLSLPADRTLVVNRGGIVGKVREVSHQLWGWEPAFRRRVRKLNPILIHAHFGPDGVRALPLARALRVPLLVTFHGYDATVKDEYARRSFYSHRVYIRHREVLKQEAQLFIAVSEFIREKLLEQGFVPNKVVVHHIGVDTETFRPDSAVTREPLVLFIGRLVEKKGCEYLIRAMSRVQVMRPDVELVVIGDGPLRPALERLARKTLRCCRFLGTQPPPNVRAWMNRARVFSVPSITAATGDSEGLPIVFCEAQAMGLPVVSFAAAGNPEAVANGETGFLAAERDWNGLAEHILLLLENDALYRKFGAAGRRRARTLFDLQKQTDALEEIYERALGETETTSGGLAG